MLKVNSLTVCYSTVRAVHNATFSVGRREIVGIVGLNGAGKTTLMKAIAGILNAHGEIIWNGTNITKTPAHHRVKLGITLVPEGRHLFSDMTVLENLKTISNNKDDLYSVYKSFPDIEGFKDKKAGKLSGGQQQMVAIARAILSNPKLLLLDEVTMGLSPKLVADVFDTIYNIGRNFCSVVVTGQEIEEITSISDRVYIMKNGRISETKKGDFEDKKIF